MFLRNTPNNVKHDKESVMMDAIVETEIKAGSKVTNGSKDYEVLRVDGDKVDLRGVLNGVKFESSIKKLLASGYRVISDGTTHECEPERTAINSGEEEIAAQAVKAEQNTQASSGGGDAHAGAPEYLHTANRALAQPHDPEPFVLVACEPKRANSSATEAPRRIRTPEEIMSDLKREQSEAAAKIDRRYKEKLFKAGQRLKSLPQKRVEALDLLQRLRGRVRDIFNDPFMLDDDADERICRIMDSVPDEDAAGVSRARNAVAHGACGGACSDCGDCARTS